jgi:2-oxoacid:acceptor oxidoreductase delta subunit (pyruvate/2-ketoisovalerate family)
MKKAMSQKDPRAVSLFIPRSHLTTQANKTGTWRFLRPRYDEKTAPCGAACPAGEDISRIQMLTSQGLFTEAWETVLVENPFPGVCGRICRHPCEAVCNRRRFDEPIAISIIERFLADTASRYDLKPHLDRSPRKKERIAVAGAGPSGLAAAYFLALLGYGCDVYEAMPEPGGVLRWGVPSYRLPLRALRDEIARIEELGARIHCENPFGEKSLAPASSAHDAVFIACGLERRRSLMVPGEDLPGVEDGVELLRKVAAGSAPALEGFVAVIGGGYAAIEVARCVLRLGAKPFLVYRGRREDMPASKAGITMAVEEGVEVCDSMTPVLIEAEAGEYILTLREARAAGENANGSAPAGPAEAKTDKIRVSRIFKAGDFEAAEQWMLPPETAALRLNNSVLDFKEGRPIVFGGDLVNTSGSVARAAASGKEAAIALDLFFREGQDAIRPGLKRCAVGGGRALSMEAHMNGPRSRRSSKVVRYGEINADYFHFSPGLTRPRLLKAERSRSFAEIDLKISANLAIRESERCFNCGICNRCDNCRLFCPDLAVVRDQNPLGRRIDYDYCKGCGVCVVECPRNAMTLAEEQCPESIGGGTGPERGTGP